jgi:multicomponent Na+:H+ antiporter subunit D
MVELGLYAVARLAWVIFVPQIHALGSVCLLIGCLTAVLGAIYCFGQRHLKRLLAFSTVSHVGIMFIGFGLLQAKALAGLAIYVVGHALVKGSLFLCAGIFLHRFKSVDEHDLRGKGWQMWGTAGVMLLGVVGLAGLPPMATFTGESLIDQAASHAHLAWLSFVIMWAEILTAGAVLRVTGRIFFGWGKVREATSRGSSHIPMGSETRGEHEKIPLCMWLPAVLLILMAMGLSESHRFIDAAGSAAVGFEHHGALPAMLAVHAEFSWHQIVTLVGSIFIAALALFPETFGQRANRAIGHALIRFMQFLRGAQSGRIGDYIAWLIFGVAAYGGLLLLMERK